MSMTSNPFDTWESLDDALESTPLLDLVPRLAPMVDAARAGAEIERCMARILAEGERLELSGSNRRMVLVAGKNFEVRIELLAGTGVPPRGSTRLFTTDVDYALFLKGRGGATFRRYELPSTWDSAVFDPAVRFASAVDFVFEGHGVVPVAAGRHVLQLREVAGEFLAITVRSTRENRAVRHVWNFDERELTPSRIAPADVNASRLKVLLDTMRATPDLHYFDRVARLSTHADHSVRWSAIQLLLTYDPKRARPFLEAACSDAHPHVRKAAATTFDRGVRKGVL